MGNRGRLIFNSSYEREKGFLEKYFWKTAFLLYIATAVIFYFLPIFNTVEKLSKDYKNVAIQIENEKPFNTEKYTYKIDEEKQRITVTNDATLKIIYYEYSITNKEGILYGFTTLKIITSILFAEIPTAALLLVLVIIYGLINLINKIYRRYRPKIIKPSPIKTKPIRVKHKRKKIFTKKHLGRVIAGLAAFIIVAFFITMIVVSAVN
jgi:hypothetical protein